MISKYYENCLCPKIIFAFCLENRKGLAHRICLKLEICNLILSQPTICALRDIIKDRTELAPRRPWYKVLTRGGSSRVTW